MPDSASWTTALMSDSCAWIASKRAWMALPKYLTLIDTSGSGSSANIVSRPSIELMRMIATTNTRMVLAVYITAGPTIMRTALRSFVARDIRSPVRRAW